MNEILPQKTLHAKYANMQVLKKSSEIDEISRVRGQEDSKLTAEVSRIDWERHRSMKFKF